MRTEKEAKYWYLQENQTALYNLVLECLRIYSNLLMQLKNYSLYQEEIVFLLVLYQNKLQCLLYVT